ncbi:hypothetical protein [Mesoflavibacter zeaxanthinifaciens]|uniref:hypothetical protein n=1 Tax=Mesoflavibacter zeaxanthinifaciens TaxID=393060 RepID=UPI003A94554E
MLPKPIRDILVQFDDLLEAVQAFNDSNERLVEVENELKLLKLWRDELESEKQSIYIIGKTGTGKSEFHNFLLNTGHKRDFIFKTSGKVETGIIQTLEHCSEKKDAFVEIIIKDQKELNKLKLPSSLNSIFDGSVIIMPLDTSENITFFRDKLISKSRDENSFDVMKAVERVNIKFPLKYLRRYRLIDTPGLASCIPDTDGTVKDHFQGKSHIFWFIDGSQRTLSDSLTLIVEEKELIKNNIDRISFIINQFDMMDYEGVTKTKTVVLERKQELTDTLFNALSKFSEVKKEELKVYFTSFKFPKENFAEVNTHQIFEKIEDSKLYVEKESHYKNIHSLISHLSRVLNILKGVIVDKLDAVEKTFSDLQFQYKELIKLRKIYYGISDETLVEITKSQILIRAVNQEKKLNTRKRFHTYLRKVNSEIDTSCRRIDNSAKRIENLEIKSFLKHLNKIRVVEKKFIEEKESIIKKYFFDSELKEKKKELEKYVKEKIESFDTLIPILNDLIDKEVQIKLDQYSLKVQSLRKQMDNYDNQLDSVSASEETIKNLDKCLLKDIEVSVSQWIPDYNNDKFDSFLSLYSLIQEHNFVKQKIIKNGR